MPDTDRKRFLSNISQIVCQLAGGRTMVIHASVLMLHAVDMLVDGRRDEVMAFGTDVALPVFQLQLSCPWDEYTVARKQFEMRGQMLFADGAWVLTWADGTELEVRTSQRDLDIDVTDGVAAGPGLDFVMRQAAKFWHAPNMPVPQWQKAVHVRRHLGVPETRGVQ